MFSPLLYLLLARVAFSLARVPFGPLRTRERNVATLVLDALALALFAFASRS